MQVEAPAGEKVWKQEKKHAGRKMLRHFKTGQAGDETVELSMPRATGRL